MLRHVRFTKDDVFVDFGCGKGRVVFTVATRRLKKVIGIDVDNVLVSVARENLVKFSKTYRNTTPIEILHMDATNFNPTEGTIFYMFNPFEYRTTQHVLDNIRSSLIDRPRDILILYNNPKHKVLFDKQTWLISEGEVDKTRLWMWRNTPASRIRSGQSTTDFG